MGELENIGLKGKFDYIIITDAIRYTKDVWLLFRALKKLMLPGTEVITYYRIPVWEVILEWFKFYINRSWKRRPSLFALNDIENLLYLNGYNVVQRGRNGSKILAPLHYAVAKGEDTSKKFNELSCSVIIPTKDEAGNIEEIVERTPIMGQHTELIFVDGNSKDGTIEKIAEMIRKFPKKDIKLIHQGKGRGKADAVKKGFSSAKGDILFILDGDLSVAPEELTKFYLTIAEGKGEFINGSRLVYPMEKDAMKFFNKLGNRFFCIFFSILFKRHITDTLCGTKVLLKSDYNRILEMNIFNGMDPFGDFELLLGAHLLNLKILELPVRYKASVYGKTKIQGFKHWLRLLKLCLIALRKLKFSKSISSYRPQY